MLPAGLELLSLNHNTLKTATKEELALFKKIKKLCIEYCRLGSIEANAFDTMRSLKDLRLNGNELTSLPDNIMKSNIKLTQLHLTDNMLTEFNATKLGLTRVVTLKLQYNRITTFDIRHLISSVVSLNNNNIERLDINIFNNNTGIFELNFSNNNIQFISGTAFHGTRGVSQLLLNNNSLYSLPEGLFKGMKLNTILLQNNKLSTFKGAFTGIENNRVTLMLHGNINFTSLNGSEFQSLPDESKLYINCQQLKSITPTELKAKVVCIPRADVVIDIKHFKGFTCNGYHCKNQGDIHGMYTCRACRPGYYTPCRGTRQYRSTCVQCPPGSYYQDQSASIKCKICRPGHFVPPERSPGKDANDCQTCPEGTNTTSVAGTRACKCLKEYSRVYRFGPCRKCSVDGFNCENEYQVLNDGFWMTWTGTEPNSAIHTKHSNTTHGSCENVYKAYVRNLDTADDSYDRATMHFSCEMPTPIKCPMAGSCVGGRQPRCSTGYTGILCALCKRGYSLEFNRCAPCPNRAKTATQFIAHIALFALVCLTISLTDKTTIKMRTGQNKKTIPRTFADILLASLKILIGFYQLLISIIYALSTVHWPVHLLKIIHILQYIQFQIISLPSIRCLNPKWNINAIDELWIIIITITSISFLVAAYYSIKSAYINCQWLSPSVESRRRNECRINCIKYIALLLFVTYIQISRKIIEILPVSCHSFCTAKRQGKCVHSMSFLRSDYSIPCPEISNHDTNMTIAYSSLVIPVGVPILFYLLLRFYVPQKQISIRTYIYMRPVGEHNEDDDEHGTNNCSYDPSINYDPLFGDSKAPMMESALKFTYENYHSRYWYWEVIEMIRKLLMTAGIVLFVGHSKIGLTCTIIVAMFFTILHAIVKPFKSKFESGAQFLSLIIIPLNLAFGAVLQSQDRQNPGIINNGLESLSLSIVLVAINSSLVLVICAKIIFVIVRKIWP